MNLPSQFITPVIAFLATVVFGFWLGKLGRPYSRDVFNIHKLIALGTVVLASSGVYRMLADLEVQALIVVLIVLATIGVIASFASGAFLSIGNLNDRTTKIIHTVAPVVVVGTLGYAIYLLG